MPQEYIKGMLQRELDEKEAIKKTLRSLKRLFILVVTVGILLFASILANTIVNRQVVLKNREETLKNRDFDIIIIKKLDSLNTVHYAVKK